MKKYEIETLFANGQWENVSGEEDEAGNRRPLLFDTIAEAEEELTELLDASGYDQDGYRIRELDVYNEFQDIRIPEFLQNDQWQDDSWHNDIAPKSTYTGKMRNEDTCLDVWVFDLSYKEMGITKPYSVTIMEEGVINEDYARECDTKEDVIKTVNEFLLVFGNGQQIKE